MTDDALTTDGAHNADNRLGREPERSAAHDRWLVR
jgi:hypothetical protein